MLYLGNVCVLSHSVVSESLYPLGYSPPVSSVHGISQARILKWVAISFSRGLPDPGTELSFLHGQADSLPKVDTKVMDFCLQTACKSGCSQRQCKRKVKYAPQLFKLLRQHVM